MALGLIVFHHGVTIGCGFKVYLIDDNSQIAWSTLKVEH